MLPLYALWVPSGEPSGLHSCQGQQGLPTQSPPQNAPPQQTRLPNSLH